MNTATSKKGLENPNTTAFSTTTIKNRHGAKVRTDNCIRELRSAKVKIGERVRMFVMKK